MDSVLVALPHVIQYLSHCRCVHRTETGLSHGFMTGGAAKRVQHMKPRRSKSKTFEPLNALMSIFGQPGGDTFYQRLKPGRVGHNTSRDLYFRDLNIITGVTIRSLRATHNDRWLDTSTGDKAEWLVLARVIKHPRIAPVTNFPYRLRKKQTWPEKTTDPEAKGDEQVMEFSGYAFTLDTEMLLEPASTTFPAVATSGEDEDRPPGRNTMRPSRSRNRRLHFFK